MAFKLIESAQARRRAVNAPHLVALVRAGALVVNANSSNARRPAPTRSRVASDEFSTGKESTRL